jgi:Domain of unknown function (DUF1707)
MVNDHSIRASDQDREVVVATLRDAYTAGRLTLEEFDERTSGAYDSKTWGDLRKLTEDLPSQPILGADVPGRRLPAPSQPPTLPAHPERASDVPHPRHRHRPVAFFPIMALWVVLALSTRSPHAIIPLTVVLIVIIAFISFLRRR